ncbi:MAG: 4Fe-4S dicluster domain-containing protein [Nitrospinae bacterium]|nr:4Fe-4S dicluster domain-containing protein [Nitrospinota bacterium]
MSQLGWKIDLGMCTGCESCTIACKAENNTEPQLSPLPLSDGGFPIHVSYRWVIYKESGTYPTPRLDFTSMTCHHCKSPACIKSCPVGAISKRAGDGIVLIDYDKCIGCKYCLWACPYGAPQFNKTTKKVEKCTFCVHRIDKGLMPACVTTCVGRALTKVDDFNFSNSGKNAPQGFGDPSLTKPAVEFIAK